MLGIDEDICRPLRADGTLRALQSHGSSLEEIQNNIELIMVAVFLGHTDDVAMVHDESFAENLGEFLSDDFLGELSMEHKIKLLAFFASLCPSNGDLSSFVDCLSQDEIKRALRGSHFAGRLAMVCALRLDFTDAVFSLQPYVDRAIQDSKAGEMEFLRDSGPEGLALATTLLQSAVRQVTVRDHTVATDKLSAVDTLRFLDEHFNVDLEVKNAVGRSLLSRSAENGDRDVVEFLLARGQPLEELDNFGRTLLYWAARGG